MASSLRIHLLAAWLSVVFCVTASSQESMPLLQAHAHNDYLHTRPLEDALSHGFCGVEADIFLQDGELLVAHERSSIKPDRTLRGLYLEPLARRVRSNGGSVYSSKAKFWLLIDIKTDGERVYEKLHSQLLEYRDVLSGLEDGKWTERAITVVISGDRPQETIAAQTTRYCGIDGRLNDLDSDRSAHLMPMISDNWMLKFLGVGRGPLSEPQKQRLKEIVDKAHARGRIVRFWATPEHEPLWQELLDAKVDLINTDQLERLQKHLLTQLK